MGGSIVAELSRSSEASRAFSLTHLPSLGTTSGISFTDCLSHPPPDFVSILIGISSFSA